MGLSHGGVPYQPYHACGDGSRSQSITQIHADLGMLPIMQTGRARKDQEMKVRVCPECHQNMLMSTGAFWTCYACSFAITSQALSMALTGEPINAARRENRYKR